jgi:uncharacterized protein
MKRQYQPRVAERTLKGNASMNPARIFLIITFALTWGSWIAVAVINKQESLSPVCFALYMLGGFGPTISAFIVRWKYSGPNALRLFLKDIIRIKVRPFWYLLVILIPAALTFLPWLANQIFTGKQNLVLLQPVYMLIPMIPFMVFGGGLEELGWRGVLLPELLKKQGAAVSIILVAVAQIAWHSPLWFMNGVAQYGTNFLGFAIPVVGTSMVLAMIYIKTGSIFLCILFHSMQNAYTAVFSAPCLDGASEAVRVLTQLLICAVTLLALVRQRNETPS